MEESTKLIIQLLSTTVIATIITGLFSFFKSKKDDKLNYIVGERKVWRDKLREVVKNISELEYSYSKDDDINQKNVYLSGIKQEISELECRINPQGLVHKKDVKLDGHIWEEIDRIYNYNDYDKLIESKELSKLRRYISALLKYDWERSKEEVKGNNFYFLQKIIDVVSIVTFIIIVYLSKNGDKLIEYIKQPTPILAIIFVFLLSMILLSNEFLRRNTKFGTCIVLGQLAFTLIIFVVLIFNIKIVDTNIRPLIMLLYVLQTASVISKASLTLWDIKHNNKEYTKVIDAINGERTNELTNKSIK